MDDRDYTLQNQRRREIITVLCEQEEISMVCLANAITGDNESPAKVVPELYDCHLPHLVDAGLIDYDGMRGTVSLIECPETVEEILQKV